MSGADGIHLLPFAVEVEEGPAYCLNSIERLKNLMELWPSQYSNQFGINADLSHLRQIGGVDSLLQSDELLKRVVNIHVSGHALFHVGDTHFVSLTDREIELINKVNELSESPGISMSLEFEGAPSEVAVAKSMDKLMKH